MCLVVVNAMAYYKPVRVYFILLVILWFRCKNSTDELRNFSCCKLKAGFRVYYVEFYHDEHATSVNGDSSWVYRQG